MGTKPRTPDAQEKANTPATSRRIDLPSGKVAECIESKGKHIIQAQKQSSDDPNKLIFALIAVCTKIDGKQIVMEDVEELSSADCFKLMAEFGSAF
jgi:hypothetical protein